MKKGGHGTAQFLIKIESCSVLAFLLLMLFIFDRKSAVDFLKILTTFIISSMIIKSYFSCLIDKLIKDRNENVYKYLFSAIFTVFIFIEIEFLLNKVYSYALCAFVCLLIFTGGSLYFATKGEDH